MIQKIKNSLMALAALVALSVPAMVPVSASAACDNIQGSLNQGVDIATGDPESCGNQAGAADGGALANIARRIVDVFSIIVGVVAVIFIIYGGFRYITSGGDSGSVSSAKNTLIYAIIGLIIVALAQFIVRVVLNTASNATT